LGRPDADEGEKRWGVVARCKTMLFMVIERFRPGEAPAVYRHVRDPGRIKGSFHAGPEARP